MNRKMQALLADDDFHVGMLMQYELQANDNDRTVIEIEQTTER